MGNLNACESMVPLIVRCADGTLAGADSAALEMHAASCRGCREALDEQKAAARLLSELPLIEAPRDFAARVRERVVPAGGLLDLINWRAWTLRLAPVAALLAFLAWLPGSTQTGTARPTTASVAIDAWSTGGTDTTTALLVSTETNAVDLLAVAYEGYAR
jgi:hypothetical protein